MLRVCTFQHGLEMIVGNGGGGDGGGGDWSARPDDVRAAPG
jgi:hypothetical protein